MNSMVIINVISKWHVYGAESYLRQLILSEKVNIKEVYVFVQFHYPSSRFRVTKGDFIYINKLDLRREIYFIEKPSKQDEILQQMMNDRAGKSSLIMISARDMNIWQIWGTRRFKNRRYIIIDEGMGNYYSAKLWKLENAALKNRLSEQKGMKEILKEIIRKLLKNILCRKVQEKKLLIKQGKELFINKNIAQNYKTYFDEVRIHFMNLPIKDGDVIFLSDNLRLMLTESIQEVVVYEQVFQHLKKMYPGKRLWFKPHPTEISDHKIERFKDIGFQILDCLEAYEDICCKYDVITCGFGSTCLLTAAAIFNRTVYSYINFISQANSYGILKEKEFLDITKHIEKIEVVIR